MFFHPLDTFTPKSMKVSSEERNMDSIAVYRIVQSLKANNSVRFDTHDLADFDSLLANLDICTPLKAADKAALLQELRPLAERYQTSEMRRMVARGTDEMLVW